MNVRRSDGTQPLAAPAPTSAPPRNALRAPTDAFVTSKMMSSPPVPPPGDSFQRPTSGEWTRDVHGDPSDPVTFYVHGNLADIEAALKNSGWSEADPHGLPSSLKYLGAAAQEEIYKALAFAGKGLDDLETGIAGAFGLHLDPLFPTKAPYVPGVDKMPVSTQTYRGKQLITAFEKDNDPLGGRHHLRIFATGQTDQNGQPVFAIAASHDVGIRFAPDHPESGFLFHTVEPNVDGERDLVLSSLQQGGTVSGLTSFQLPFGGPSPIGEFVGDSKGYELSLGARSSAA